MKTYYSRYMETKRKLIDLSQDTIRTLTIMAAHKGVSLKKMIEEVLDEVATDYDETATFNYLLQNYPDGQVMLEEKEHNDFIKWLGVVEK